MTRAPLDLLRYLLGACSAEEEAALDERVFLDEAFAEERDLAADELIESYLAGRLSPADVERFETHFLAAAAHRGRLRMLRDLRAVGRRESGRVPGAHGRRLLWAAAAALLAALAAWLLHARAARPADPRIVVQPTPAPTEAPRVVPTPGAPPSARTRTATVALPASPRPISVSVAADVRAVRFEVPLPKVDAPSYTARVTRDGREVWRDEDLVRSADGATLAVTVPADVLQAGDASLSVEPEALRSATPHPDLARRTWTLRLVSP